MGDSNFKDLLKSQDLLRNAMTNPFIQQQKQFDLINKQLRLQLESPMSKIIRQQKEFTESITSPMSKIIQQQNHLMEMVNSPLQEWHTKQLLFKDSLSQVFTQFETQWDKIHSVFGEVSELLKEAKDNFEKYKELMIVFNFPPHHDMNFNDFSELYDFYLENGIEEIEDKVSEIIINNFSDEIIASYYKNWLEIEWLRPRFGILHESMLSYFDGRFFSAVSTLLPQIEGIIVDRGSTIGYVSQREVRRIGESLLDESGDFSLDDAVRMFYVECVLDSFQHGQSIRSPLSRHAILHGADTRYGTKLNALRCILFFDYLVSKLITDTSTHTAEEEVV